MMGVVPLDAQFAVWPKKTVPDTLRDLLFDQPTPSEAEIETYGCVDAVPAMKTYAILDAAKVPHLPHMLESSGLSNRCLFKGKAEEDLRAVAPYLVELVEDNIFTRRLFTRSGTPADMWDKEPGIYLRSRATLEDMWKHFRKFTKLYDAARGTWLYWRFWEAGSLTSFIPNIVAEEQQKFCHDIDAFIGLLRDGQVAILRKERLDA